MNRGFRAKSGLSYRRVEGIARRVRLQLGLAVDSALPDGCRFFEHLVGGFKVDTSQGRLPICYSCNALPPDVEGLTIYSEEDHEIVVSLSEATYNNLRLNEGRARFSASHEFGHAVLHADLAIELGRIPHRAAALHRETAPAHPEYMDTEWQANAFAGALLVPMQGIRRLEAAGFASPPLFGLAGEIQMEFGVSSTVAERRLQIYRGYF